MLGCYDFCGHYEWTFAWLEQQGGRAWLHAYWDEAIHQDAQRHAAALIAAHGLKGMQAYWGHALTQEAAGYHTTATEQTFRLDIHDCPSKGFLLRNGLLQHTDYCDHCLGWIGPMMQRAGFVVDHEHNHFGQCWWEMRAQTDATPPSAPGTLTAEHDVRLRPDWQTNQTPPDIFLRANHPDEKQK